MTDNIIADGRHRAIIRVSPESIQFGVTGEGDNAKEQTVVLFDIVGETDPDNGRSISWFGYLNDKNFDRTIEALRICGWEGDELAELPQLAAEGKLATEVELVVNHEEFEGKWSAKVRWVNRAGGGAVKVKKPIAGADLAAFSARMKGRVRVAGNGSVARPGGSRPAMPSRSNNGDFGGYGGHPNAPGNGGPDDDIPF